MKAALAFCFLCAIPAFSQSVAPKVQMGSRVPSVTIRFGGEGSNSYSFLIQNGSAHGITAFDVLLVPSGVQRKGNRFLCHGRCSESSEIDNIDKPAIKAGGTAQVTYDSATVTGGAVIVEAAIFDDGTYAGSERAAAYLIANKMGDQAEFDRIVSAVDQIMASTGPQNVGKRTRIETELAGLPVDADSAMLQTFYRWFPNLRDCDGRFPQMMKGVSAQEKANVQARLQPLLSAGDPSDTALAQWWSATEQYLAGFGCSECAAKMASPSPPVKQRMVSVGCNGQTSGSGSTTMSVEVADDSEADGDGTGDGTDQTVANDADPGHTAGEDAQDASDDELSMTGEPADAASPVTAPATAARRTVPAVSPPAAPVAPARAPETTASNPAPVPSTSVVTRARHIPIPPRLIPFGFGGMIPGAASGPRTATGSEQETLRPVTDEQLYPRYFRYVVAWDKYLADGGTLEAAANAWWFLDPFPAGMNETERRIVTSAAYDGEDALRQFMTGMHPESTTTMQPAGIGIQAHRFVPPTTWRETQQLMQRSKHYANERDERAEIVKSRLEKLRSRLGKASFRALDDHVYGLFHGIPGRIVRDPLPETALYGRYLHYIALLDKFAGNDSEDGKAAATVRADEQMACKLNDKDEGILQQVADDFQKELMEHRPKTMPLTTNSEAVRPAATSVRAVESGPFAEERKRIVDSHIEQLRSRLGEAGFEKVEKRVHVLYESDGPQRVVPVDAPETQIKSAGQSRVAPPS